MRDGQTYRQADRWRDTHRHTRMDMLTCTDSCLDFHGWLIGFISIIAPCVWSRYPTGLMGARGCSWVLMGPCLLRSPSGFGTEFPYIIII